MEKITSFTIDHLNLLPGLYVSRKDRVGQEIVTTFDLRLTRPNFEPVMNTAEVHTMEHLAATYLRNEPQWKGSILALWAAGRAFICCWPGTMIPARCCRWCVGASNLFGITGMRFPVPVPGTAATTWT